MSAAIDFIPIPFEEKCTRPPSDTQKRKPDTYYEDRYYKRWRARRYYPATPAGKDSSDGDQN